MPKQYGTPIGEEAPSNATDRRKVQPPSEAYIRAEMARAERIRKAAEQPREPAKKPKAQPTSSGPSPSDPDNPTRDLSAAKAARTIGGRKKQIDDAVEGKS